MKRSTFYSSFLALLFLIQGQWASAQQNKSLSTQEVLERLISLPNCKIKPLEGWEGTGWELILKQPLKHDDPKAGSFRQHIYLKHIDTQAPTIFVTEGYALRGLRNYELSTLMGANQIRVEYRYFGESAPAKRKGWAYLRNREAANDLHRIRELLGEIYQGPWINTGISKGGQTSLIYRRFYPDDVSATVAYVAPMAIGLEDPRTDRWQDSIGTEACRTSIEQYQRAVLTNRAESLGIWMAHAKSNKEKFSIGADVAFEYAVLEYPFSFWQMGVDCNDIPSPDASAQELMAHLLDAVGTSLYHDKGIKAYQPHFYQAMYEQGYYGFPTEPVADLLQVTKEPSNRLFAPKGVEIPFHPEFVPDVLTWLDENGDKILYIYGELDTWTACAVNPNPERDALKLTVADGDHRVRMRHLSPEQKRLVYEKLEKWTGHGIKD